MRLACSFQCTITLTRQDNGVTANAKSILSVLYLAAGFGIEISVNADGVDETEAVTAIEGLFSSGFGEI